MPEITEAQVLAELGRLHLENLALRAELADALARLAELATPTKRPDADEPTR